jgi:hypothetical protein
MKRFIKNISLVYECDEPTLQRAATLGKDNRAMLTIVHPVKGLPGGPQKMTVGNKPIDIGKLLLQVRSHSSAWIPGPGRGAVS